MVLSVPRATQVFAQSMLHQDRFHFDLADSLPSPSICLQLWFSPHRASREKAWTRALGRSLDMLTLSKEEETLCVVRAAILPLGPCTPAGAPVLAGSTL